MLKCFRAKGNYTVRLYFLVIENDHLTHYKLMDFKLPRPFVSYPPM